MRVTCILSMNDWSLTYSTANHFFLTWMVYDEQLFCPKKIWKVHQSVQSPEWEYCMLLKPSCIFVVVSVLRLDFHECHEECVHRTSMFLRQDWTDFVAVIRKAIITASFVFPLLSPTAFKNGQMHYCSCIQSNTIIIIRLTELCITTATNRCGNFLI